MTRAAASRAPLNGFTGRNGTANARAIGKLPYVAAQEEPTVIPRWESDVVRELRQKIDLRICAAHSTNTSFFQSPSRGR